MMYNLLVTAGDNAWDEGSYVWDTKHGRVLESPYTSGQLRKKLATLTPESLNFLKALPTLFMYENGAKGEPQLGRIRKIDRRGEEIRVLFEFDDTAPALTDKLISRLKWDLQIDDFEFSRTHWAVKDVDLISVLRSAGISIGGGPAVPNTPAAVYSESVLGPKRFSDRFRGAQNDVVTILFTDVVGSTKLKEALGDSKANELIQEHFGILRQGLNEGAYSQELATAGDSMLCIFSTPSAAVSFGLKCQARLAKWNVENPDPINIRIGIHLGEVQFVHEPRFDIRGAHVDRCARIMSEAGPGRIFLSRTAYESAFSSLKGVEIPHVQKIEWRNRGNFPVKGVSEPLEIWEVCDAANVELMAEVENIAVIVNAGGKPDLESELSALVSELVHKDWRKFFWLRYIGGGPDLAIIDGKCEPFEADQQFLAQDIDRLADLGFLVVDYMRDGEKTYELTRQACNYVKALDAKKGNRN